MNETNKKPAGWKQRFAHELIEYWITFIYMAFFFGAFAWYQRLILAQYQISYLHYGVALVEALVLAKVVLIGDALRLGRGFEDKPLMVPTLYKALVFTVFVAAFGVLEHTVGGLVEGKGLGGGWAELASTGWYEVLARCLVVFVAFIPFFGFRELERVLPEGKIRALFVRKRPAPEPSPSGAPRPATQTDESPGRAAA